MKAKYTTSLVATIAISMIVASCAPQMKPEESCNFIQNSQKQRVSWKADLPVKMYIHKSVPEEYHDAIFNSMAQWNHGFHKPFFEIVDIDHSDSGPKKNGRNVIHWLHNWEDDRANEQGRTTVYWLGDKIIEADIRINAANFTFSVSEKPTSGAVDLEGLMVHELGHVIGLKHNEMGDSVMSATLAHGEERRELRHIDVESLACEY
jgi:predicted Zn-dependent protease